MSKVETRAVGTPSWFDVMTPDLEGARKFYGELFGWQFVVGPAEMGYYTMCQLGGANAAGMGLSRPDAKPQAVWSTYFHTTDANASAESIKANGGSIIMGPMDVMGEGHMLVAADPTGAVFGFWQPGRHTGAHVKNEPGAMAWAEVGTRDSATAREFYAKVLNKEVKQMPGGMQYWTLNDNGQATSGVMHMGPEFPAEIPAHWMVYFAVADTDAACKLITERGGQLRHGPVDSPEGRFAVVSDPWGAVFSIIKL